VYAVPNLWRHDHAAVVCSPTSATHPDSGEPGACCAQEPEPRLPGLLKMLLWAQTQLDERVEYPRCSDLVTATLSDPGSTAAA